MNFTFIPSAKTATWTSLKSTLQGVENSLGLKVQLMLIYNCDLQKMSQNLSSVSLIRVTLISTSACTGMIKDY